LLYFLRNQPARRRDALALELPPHLTHAIDAEIRLEHTTDLGAQHRVAPHPVRGTGRIRPLRHVRVIGGRGGDRQHLADRLDPMGAAMIVDERDHGLNRRSSSAWAKYADAL